MWLNQRKYSFKECFDVNLSVDYECDHWEHWQIIREFISNALDAVAGNTSQVAISEDCDFIHIADQGEGYPLVYAKRIGASSKKGDSKSIGMFGEGTKLALLSCVRKNIRVMLASQNWLIIPRLQQDEEDIEVMVFDIYGCEEPVSGSIVSIEACPEVLELVNNISSRILHFTKQQPLFSCEKGAIYEYQEQTSIFNKGIWIKNIPALFSYDIQLEELNRDRSLIDENALNTAIRSIWQKVNDATLIQTYLEESRQIAIKGINSPLLEFSGVLYPEDKDFWLRIFREMFGDKVVYYTGDLAAKEATYSGFYPVKLEYFGQTLAENLGIDSDQTVCRADYEFTLVREWSKEETDRLQFFRQVASMLDLECPQDIQLFEDHVRSDNLLGQYSGKDDIIYLRRITMNDRLPVALDTFLHELMHRKTGADDYDRAFADGLSALSTSLAMRLVKEVGIPTRLKVERPGLILPKYFTYTANDMTCSISLLVDILTINVGGRIIKAIIPGLDYKATRWNRPVVFRKGRFYVSLPGILRQLLPEDIEFHIIPSSIAA